MTSEIIGRLAKRDDNGNSRESDAMLGFCRTCVNIGTPICKECSFVAQPSGRVCAPSCFIAFEGDDGLSTDIACQMACEVAARLIKRQPIPVRWIIEYNGLVAKSGR